MIDHQLLRQAAQLRRAQPETAVREIYETYQRTAGQSGHDLIFELFDFRTVGVGDYSRFQWLDLMTPPTGFHISQVRHYQNAPWLTRKRVYYDLAWKPYSTRSEAKSFRILEELRGTSVIQQVVSLGRRGRMDDVPLAVTTYRVRVSMAGRARTYRAAGFWFSSADGESFELRVQDHVVPRVSSAMSETAAIVDEKELSVSATLGSGGAGRALGSSTAEECYSGSNWIHHQSLENFNSQGHSAGYHSAVLGMKAQCIASTDCHLQCLPVITYQGCEESANADPYGTCDHFPMYDSEFSGSSANGEAAACGTALACGVRECCGFWCSPTGGVGFSFSGSGGGLTGRAYATGGDVVYSMNLSDNIECPAPTPKADTCGALTATSTAGRVTAPIFIPCDDGGNPGPGPDEPSPSDGGSQGDGTPILLDLGGSGFELTDLAGGVAFDLDADGTPEPISWTAAGSDDAFLVLDRDGDGAIDDGSELFGDATPQPPSAEPHGYRALAVFDGADAGGDGDGRITAADAVFADLELWRDADHDGVADAGERQSLAEAGVVALELDYVESRRRDRHGNLVRYTSRFEVEAPRGRSLKVAADVIFLQAQP